MKQPQVTAQAKGLMRNLPQPSSTPHRSFLFHIFLISETTEVKDSLEGLIFRFNEDGGPQDYVKMCVCLLCLIAFWQPLHLHEAHSLRVENGSWYKKLYGK